MARAADAAAAVRVTLTAPVRHRCPFRDEHDEGTLEVSYEQRGEVVELHALRRFLEELAAEAITHEAFTGRVAGFPLPPGATVTTRWRTAGIDVTVTA